MSDTFAECGCPTCCVRTVDGRTVSSSLFVWDPIDYSVERNHEFDVAFSYTKRPPGDTTSSPYWGKPASADILLWCNEEGSGEAARIRFRVEHGQTRTLGFTTSDNADTQPLASHLVSCRSDVVNAQATDNLLFGGQPQFSDVVELLVFVELIVDGEVEQSKQIVSLPPRRYEFLGGAVSSNLFTNRDLNAKFHVALSGDFVHVSGYLIGAGSPGRDRIFPNPSESLAFPHFVFAPQDIGNRIQGNRMARSGADPALVTISASHIAKRKTQLKTPCVVADVSPYCGDGDLAGKESLWPWKHVGDCNAWKRGGSIVGAPCGSTKTALQLTIPEAYMNAAPQYGRTALGDAMGKLIADTYELQPTTEESNSLIESSFWFSDTPGTTVTIDSATYTLEAIEISAGISLNWPVVPPIAPCQNSHWPVQVFFNLSCVIGDGTRNVRLTYGFAATTDLSFFAGNDFDFRPYGNRSGAGVCIQCVRPRVGVWPFFFQSGGGDLAISYGPDFFPSTPLSPYKVKLI